MNSSEGFPLKRHKRSSCFMLSAPGNSGMRPMSSATMQPTAHMSTADVYLCQPTKTSGALYHRVVTYSVIASIFESLLSLYTLARPKSATFKQQSPLTSRLRGLNWDAEKESLQECHHDLWDCKLWECRFTYFKSRCTILAACKYFSASSSWYVKYCTCWSFSVWGDRIIWARSVSIISKTT